MRLIEWTAGDGTRLAARLHGPEAAGPRPVLCLPGLTRNSRDFDVLATTLAAAGRAVAAVDYRGRGLSDRAPASTYRPDVEAGDVVGLLDLLGWTAPAIVGTSRGGIIAMLLAATAPGHVGPVVLNDIGPVLERQGLLAIRDRLAATAGKPGPATWAAAAESLRRAMGAAFPALGPDDWARFARQIYREDAGGGLALDYDPALAVAFSGFDPAVGIPPFWPAFEALAPRPVLAIRGENSDLLSEETLAEMGRRLPGMEIHRVPGQGHAPTLDDAPTIRRIAAFLDAADRPGRRP